MNCLLCVTKPARKLAKKYSDRKASARKAFCSVACAARYGLIAANDDDIHWCKKTGNWTLEPECEGCEGETR